MLETHETHPEDKEHFNAARYGQEKQATQAHRESDQPSTASQWPNNVATLSPEREKAARTWTILMQDRIASVAHPEVDSGTTFVLDSPDRQ